VICLSLYTAIIYGILYLEFEYVVSASKMVFELIEQGLPHRIPAAPWMELW
jgi:hypothetical protein